MDSLIFSINAVLPLVTLAALGYILRRIKVISPEWASGANRLCYRTFLPVMLFMNIYGAEHLSAINWGLTIFATAGILFAFSTGFAVLYIFSVQNRHRSVIWQTTFRSNFAILGMPLAISLFGREGGQSAAVLSLFTIPTFTVLSVVVLSGKLNIGGIVVSIIKNPLIIGVLLGFIVLAVQINLSKIPFLFSVLNSLSQVASPLMLIALGAQFNFKATRGLLKPLAIGVGMRLLFVPAAVLCVAFIFFPRFHGADFAALISLFAAPVAVAATVMAVEMGGDGELAGQMLFWTTVLSAVTIFMFVFIFKALGALG